MSHFMGRALSAVVFRKLLPGMTFCKRLELVKFMNDTVLLQCHGFSGIKHPGIVPVSSSPGKLLPHRLVNNDARWWNSEDKDDESHEITNHTKAEAPIENRKVRKMFGSSVLEELDIELASGKTCNWSVGDWERLEQKVLSESSDLGKVWEGVCMNMLYCHGLVQSGLSLMEYIESQGRSPSLVTKTSFIALCGWHGGRDYQRSVLDCYDKLRERYDVFDSNSCKLLIQGLSGTDRWKEAIPLLEMSKLTLPPGSGCFSPIILAALHDKDIRVVSEMLDAMGENNRIPQNSIFIKLVEACSSGDDSYNFQALFQFLRKYEWFPSADVAEKLAQECKRGICTSCGCRAAALELTQDQFTELRNKFMERAVISGDVFLKSTPNEMKRFTSFIQNAGSCDVVLDSLNIVLGHAVKAPVQKKIQLLHNAVDFFWKRGKNVLVLGRKHMQGWPQREMKAIQNKAKFFFAENQSADDPFLLYAALYNGPQTLVVSNDEMRDHKYLLGPRMGQVFAQWQRGHQVYVDAVIKKSSFVRMRMPKPFETVAQQDSAGWHIPYEDHQERFSYHRPNSWLCLRKK